MTASPGPAFSPQSCCCAAAGLMLSFLNESPTVVKRVTQNSSFTFPSSKGWKSISSTVSEHKYLSLGIFFFCSSWVISLTVWLLRWQVYTSDAAGSSVNLVVCKVCNRPAHGASEETLGVEKKRTDCRGWRDGNFLWFKTQHCHSESLGRAVYNQHALSLSHQITDVPLSP